MCLLGQSSKSARVRQIRGGSTMIIAGCAFWLFIMQNQGNLE